ATRGKGLEELLGALKRYLPEQPAIHSGDDLTDRNERFLAAEFLREKLFRLLGEELPYSTGVEIEKFEEERGMRRIHAAIVARRACCSRCVPAHSDGCRWWRAERAARARLCAGCCSPFSRLPCPGSARGNCGRSRAPSGSADNRCFMAKRSCAGFISTSFCCD